MRLTCAAAVCVGALIWSDALAADIPVKATQRDAITAYDWSGFYAGGHVGYLWGQVRNGTPNPAVGEIRPSGVMGGVQAGYNVQLPTRWVLGVEVGTPLFSAVNTVPEPFAPGVTYTGRVLYSVNVIGRAGYAFDRYLPYALGGFVYGRGEGRLEGAPGFDSTARATHTGWMLGAGLDVAVARNWSVFSRYAFARMSDEDYNFSFGQRRAGFSAHAVMVGFNYHFGR